jgi:hypothetical protein
LKNLDLHSETEIALVREDLKLKIISAAHKGTTTEQFNTLALEVFAYQYKYNDFYREYCSLIGTEFNKISSAEAIPFLPIQFFKNQDIRTGTWPAQTLFSSSGTTGSTPSLHAVRDKDFYLKLAELGFNHFYGAPAQFCVLGLLPSYLERTGSSLVAMVADFIDQSEDPESGFFLNNTAQLLEILQRKKAEDQPTLLIGVSFGLLDFVEEFIEENKIKFPNLIVMETGGMKGRRKEWVRSELHNFLKLGFGVENIHSEYGMTELFSQAYATQDGIFLPTPTLRAYLRPINNPLGLEQKPARLGVLNLIDLGNLDTCAFIATDDLGKINANGSFEVLGRLDNADIRGCNLMVAS